LDLKWDKTILLNTFNKPRDLMECALQLGYEQLIRSYFALSCSFRGCTWAKDYGWYRLITGIKDRLPRKE
jgi:hypothetical protein